MRESMGASNVGPSMMRPASVHNESDDDDFDEDNNVVQENSMQVAAEIDKNDTEWVDNARASNEYVEVKDLSPDEF